MTSWLRVQMKSPFAMPFQSSSLESTFAPAQPSTSSSGNKEVSDYGPAAPQHLMEHDEVNTLFPGGIQICQLHMWLHGR